jgi:NTE family protein
MTALGLVLTGGGARAAYQAGVLRGIAELIPADAPCPFTVLTGVSGGAINATGIATRMDDFRQSTAALWDTWSALRTEDVFRTDALTILRLGTKWVRDLALGGLLGDSSSTYLLDTSPLRRLLERRVEVERIGRYVRSGAIHGIAVSATSYATGAAVTFFDGHPSIRPWARSSRVARRCAIELEHIMASSAIPLFFPPQPLGPSFYGDGCIRLTAPLSPAIHLGAERVLAIGVRFPRPSAEVSAVGGGTVERLTVSDVAGVLLNAVFLDSLETDLERMQRINRTLALVDARHGAAHPDALRQIPVLAIRPSRDLGTLATDEFEQLPMTLRYMLRGLGASGTKGWDLVSYLAFEPAHVRRLLELGLRDAHARAAEIRAFLSPVIRHAPQAPQPSTPLLPAA